MESIVSAHEITHHVVRNGKSGFIFKLDYEKAYDRIDRSFLIKVLESRGFSPRWVSLVKTLLDNGSVGVRINDTNSEYFIAGRGVRQGDPISPLLFNLTAEVFTKMLMKAAGHGQITGLLTSFNQTGVVSMQYADDTLLFMSNSLEAARNIKWTYHVLSRCLGCVSTFTSVILSLLMWMKIRLVFLLKLLVVG